MSLWHIAWSYLWNRKFTTCLTILSVALGVGLISAVLTLREETRKRFEEEGNYCDIVVGSAKQSRLQLVLSTVYYMDMPQYTIKFSDYEKLKAREEVEAAYPVCMGDTYKGYRIVGTIPDLIKKGWELYSGRQLFMLESGSRGFDGSFEAVLGATVANDTELKVGDTFLSSHGLVGGVTHEDHPYTVVGILKRSGTPMDRAIFCDMKSIWDAHAHSEDDETTESIHEEVVADDDHTADDHEHQGDMKITAVLLNLRSPAYRGTVKDSVNRELDVMAAEPIMEIRSLYEQLLSTIKTVLMSIGYLVVVISSISILIGLYMSILQRKRDMAVMRALGAAKGEIFGAVLIEAFWVTILGIIAGWATGTVLCAVLGKYFEHKVGFSVTAISMTPDLVTAYSAVLVMGMLAGIIPAWQAYRTNVAHDLAEL